MVYVIEISETMEGSVSQYDTKMDIREAERGQGMLFSTLLAEWSDIPSLALPQNKPVGVSRDLAGRKFQSRILHFIF